MESTIAIANFFIRRSIESSAEMTQMKLIKLVYISHGWFLGLTGNPLLPEAVQAWEYGPVVPTIYRLFKKYGRGQISEMVFDPQTRTYPMPSDPEVITFLQKIWEVYGKFNGLQLSALTHQQGTPWYTTWNEQGGKGNSAVAISDDLIRSHYLGKMGKPVLNGIH